jgi:hypothetical protein
MFEIGNQTKAKHTLLLLLTEKRLLLFLLGFSARTSIARVADFAILIFVILSDVKRPSEIA